MKYIKIFKIFQMHEFIELHNVHAEPVCKLSQL